MDKNILLNLISLLKAIEENNLSNTKLIIDYINSALVNSQLISSTLIIELIDQMLEYNESLEYTINNLNNIKDIETIKWFFNLKNLINNNNNFQLEKEILNYLNENNFNKFKNDQLNQASIIVNRPDLLLKIKNLE